MEIVGILLVVRDECHLRQGGLSRSLDLYLAAWPRAGSGGPPFRLLGVGGLSLMAMGLLVLTRLPLWLVLAEQVCKAVKR